MTSSMRFIHDRKIKELFESHVFHVRPQTVLNIGCGKKEYKRYKEIFSGMTYLTQDVTGFDDYTPDYIFDITRQHIKDKKFDLILCLFVLEHINEPKKAIDNMHKMLKKDGIIIFSVPFVQNIHTDYDYFRYTEQGVVYLFRRFDEIYIEPFGNPIISFFKYLCNKKIGILTNIFSRELSYLFGKTDRRMPTGYFGYARKG